MIGYKFELHFEEIVKGWHNFIVLLFIYDRILPKESEDTKSKQIK
jgi:hypothetical protein